MVYIQSDFATVPHVLSNCIKILWMYTAKLLFHQSSTRHSDYTVTGLTVVTVVSCQQHGDYTIDELCSHRAAGSCQR